jgi:hypothetical protein
LPLFDFLTRGASPSGLSVTATAATTEATSAARGFLAEVDVIVDSCFHRVRNQLHLFFRQHVAFPGFDAVFFVDLPSTAEKDSIWHLYRQQYDIGPSEKRPSDTDWTGAEIKSACRLAALLDLSLAQAAQNVVPVAVTAAESIDKLRTWASGRCLSASQPGIYRKDSPSGPRRRVNRGPSDSSLN